MRYGFILLQLTLLCGCTATQSQTAVEDVKPFIDVSTQPVGTIGAILVKFVTAGVMLVALGLGGLVGARWVRRRKE